MDGGTHNDPFNNLNLPTPFPDALQEFKVETSALPARYGHHAASAVNLVTKSGTNTFHGDAFEFVRDYHFNARNFFAPDARQPEPQPVRRHARRRRSSRTSCSSSAATRGSIEKSNPPDDGQLRADRGDAGRRLHRRSPRPACSGRQITLSPGAGFVEQHDQPVRVQPGRAERSSSTCRSRPIRAAGCSTASRTTTPSTRRWPAPTTRSTPARRCSRATSTRSTTTRRPTTAPTR